MLSAVEICARPLLPNGVQKKKMISTHTTLNKTFDSFINFLNKPVKVMMCQSAELASKPYQFICEDYLKHETGTPLVYNYQYHVKLLGETHLR